MELQLSGIMYTKKKILNEQLEQNATKQKHRLQEQMNFSCINTKSACNDCVMVRRVTSLDIYLPG